MPLTLNVTSNLRSLLPWQPSAQMVRHLLADDATSGPCGRNVSSYLTENDSHGCSGALSASRWPAVFIWTSSSNYKTKENPRWSFKRSEDAAGLRKSQCCVLHQMSSPRKHGRMNRITRLLSPLWFRGCFTLCLNIYKLNCKYGVWQEHLMITCMYYYVVVYKYTV